VGKVKETLMGIGNFGGKKKKETRAGLLRSYKGLKLFSPYVMKKPQKRNTGEFA
jgi:hypothetical protein